MDNFVECPRAIERNYCYSDKFKEEKGKVAVGRKASSNCWLRR